MTGEYFFLRVHQGERQISWRVWVLVWLLPVFMLAGGVVELSLRLWQYKGAVPVTGTVERVYEWDNDIPFSDAPAIYAPVFSYTEPDGRETGASSDMADPSLNFEIGSQHDILVFPGRDRDVIVPGPHNFKAGKVVLALGVALCLPALLMSWVLWRWREKSQQSR